MNDEHPNYHTHYDRHHRHHRPNHDDRPDNDHPHHDPDAEAAEAEVEPEPETVDEPVDDHESQFSESSDDDAPVDANTQYDMDRLQNCFPGFRHQYRLIKRIGEGQHSCHYSPSPRPR